MSQRRVQEFLKEYQAKQQITVILTSHYMKDVEALCQRAVIINEGEVKHDGPLAEIVDRFSTHKVIDLEFSDANVPSDLGRFGEVFETTASRARLRVPRTKVPELLAGVLAAYTNVEDVGVHDRPLEEVIAEMFTQTRRVKNAQETSKEGR